MADQPSVRGSRRSYRLFAVVVCLLTGALFLGACGDNDSSGETKSEETPEDVKAPIAEVLEKLPAMVDGGDKAKSASADGDFEAAAEEFDELHEVWEEVEGTVKDKDADLYEQIETAQGLIKDGAENENAERVATGAEDQAAAVQQFIDANE